jgi:hypothetical protein
MSYETGEVVTAVGKKANFGEKARRKWPKARFFLRKNQDFPDASPFGAFVEFQQGGA